MKYIATLIAGIVIGTVGITAADSISSLHVDDTLTWGGTLSSFSVVKIHDDENAATCYVYLWHGISCVATSTKQ